MSVHVIVDVIGERERERERERESTHRHSNSISLSRGGGGGGGETKRASVRSETHTHTKDQKLFSILFIFNHVNLPFATAYLNGIPEILTSKATYTVTSEC